MRYAHTQIKQIYTDFLFIKLLTQLNRKGKKMNRFESKMFMKMLAEDLATANDIDSYRNKVGYYFKGTDEMKKMPWTSIQDILNESVSKEEGIEFLAGLANIEEKVIDVDKLLGREKGARGKLQKRVFYDEM